MKVVDKRRETDEWHAGDVICYWDNPSEKIMDWLLNQISVLMVDVELSQ